MICCVSSNQLLLVNLTATLEEVVYGINTIPKVLRTSLKNIMKATLVIIFAVAVAVLAFPAENPDNNLSSGMSDLLSSISKIQDRVKGMRFLASGNHSSLVDQEVLDGMSNLSKNVTYENLIDRVQLASQKVKELQQRLSGVLKDLDKNYQRPGDKTEKPATAA